MDRGHLPSFFRALLLREGLITGLALGGIDQRPEESTAPSLELALHWETIALTESYSQRIAALPNRALGWFQSQ